MLNQINSTIKSLILHAAAEIKHSSAKYVLSENNNTVLTTTSSKSSITVFAHKIVFKFMEAGKWQIWKREKHQRDNNKPYEYKDG